MYASIARNLSIALLAATLTSAPRAEILSSDDFESGLGAWSNAAGDDFDWTRDSGGTPSNGTGPSDDHTPTGAGFYMYTEASNPNNPARTALLEGPCVDLVGRSEASWSFWYHMLGAGMGSLHAEVAAGCGTTWMPVFSVAGAQGSAWLPANISLAAHLGTSVRLRFRGVTGATFASDMAIDDVVIDATAGTACSADPECDDGLGCTADACVANFCRNADTCTGTETCSAERNACVGPPGQSFVAALDLQRFKDHIANLSSPNAPIGGSRYWNRPGNSAALDYIETELESYGYTVERHAYTYSSQTRHNIYATKVGTTQPESMYIVSAHMDSYNTESSGSVFAPGADDDASGTSLVLEAARVFAPADARTEQSIRFVLWNNEETGLDGSEAYVASRAGLRGVENPPGSGLYPEPNWLGVIQHDMILFDHGLPPQPNQIPGADIDIEYQASATFGGGAIALATALLQANGLYATDYPAEIGSNMNNTDSKSFQSVAPAVSVRENQRIAEIGNGANPHWHKNSDVIAAYSEADFLLGFNTAQTTVGAVATLAGARRIECGDAIVDPGESCDDGNTDDGDCCSASCQLDTPGASCADGDLCNGAETCDALGACASGTPLVCDDADICNGAETCNALTGCALGTPLVCDDADICNGAETCDALSGCALGTPLVCDDADICNGAETCNALSGCALGTPLVCDDADICNGAETCDALSGCALGTPLVCDDADVCNGAETCDALSGCEGGEVLSCDDFDACTTDACSALGGCSHDPIPGCGVPVPALGVSGRVALGLLLLLGVASLPLRRRRARIES